MDSLNYLNRPKFGMRKSSPQIIHINWQQVTAAHVYDYPMDSKQWGKWDAGWIREWITKYITVTPNTCSPFY